MECGSQFSVALTKSGAVYTWYVGLCNPTNTIFKRCKFVWALCLHVCLCTICMAGAHRCQKSLYVPLDLNLAMIVIYHVTRVYLKNGRFS